MKKVNKFLTYIKLRKSKLFNPPLRVPGLDIFNCKALSSFELRKIFPEEA